MTNCLLALPVSFVPAVMGKQRSKRRDLYALAEAVSRMTFFGVVFLLASMLYVPPRIDSDVFHDESEVLKMILRYGRKSPFSITSQLL